MPRHRTAARQLILRQLIEEHPISSQDELVDLLASLGHRVTQATVSRDLRALGAVKRLDPEVGERYAMPAGRQPESMQELARRMRDFVIHLGASGNLVLLRTPPGSAGSVAAALDAAALEGVLGTLGGDDTVMVVAREPTGGPALLERLRAILES